MTKPFIIAEIGNNHEGSLKTALDMIESAKECGADAVKFQTFVTGLYANQLNKDRFEMLQRFRLEASDYIEITNNCKRLEIEFLSTPLDMESATFLRKITDKVKISSGDNTNNDLITFCVETFDKIFISSGLVKTSTFVENLRSMLDESLLSKLTPLFCVALYPHEPKLSSVSSLKALARYKHMFNSIGYSDHTRDNICSVLALAFGATVFEKHFTLDNNFSSFRDHKVGLNPKDFKRFVEDIHVASSAVLSDEREVLEIQARDEKAFRRSPVYSAPLSKGTIFTSKNYHLVRPAIGITPDEVNALVGKRLEHSVSEGDLVSETDFID